LLAGARTRGFIRSATVAEVPGGMPFRTIETAKKAIEAKNVNVRDASSCSLHGEMSAAEGLLASWVLIQKELISEPVFVNVYGAQESILRNRFRQPM
jgi:hypothetical protein